MIRPITVKLMTFLCIALFLSACVGKEVFSHGFRATDDDISQVPVGSSVEQVQIVFGSPSTKSTLENNPVWYYISQTSSRDLLTPRRLENQRVLAVHFDENDRVASIANYGLKDSKVFD